MNSIILYSTAVCDLCEEAEALIIELGIPDGFILIKQDIVDNPVWFEKYRVSIPVVEVNGKLLYWPFDQQQIRNFLLSNIT